MVEDERTLAAQLAAGLGEAHYTVDCAHDGEVADFLIHSETYDAVVLDLEALGEFADGDDSGAGKAFDGEQGLVLLRGDAGGQRGFFAEAQEAAQCVAKGGEELVIFQRDGP